MSTTIINHVINAKNVYQALIDEFGSNEFTTKQAKAVLRGTGVSFNYIRDLLGATVSRVETFEIKVKGDSDTYKYVALNGREFELPLEVAKHYADTFGGHYFKSEEKTISAERYYFTLTPEKFEVAAHKTIGYHKADCVLALESQICELERKVASLKTKLDIINKL